MWFAEVRDPGSGDDETRLIVCNPSASPPSVRLLPRDLRTIEQFRAWLATADTQPVAARQPIAPGPTPVESLPPPDWPSQPAPSQPAP